MEPHPQPLSVSSIALREMFWVLQLQNKRERENKLWGKNGMSQITWYRRCLSLCGGDTVSIFRPQSTKWRWHIRKIKFTNIQQVSIQDHVYLTYSGGSKEKPRLTLTSRKAMNPETQAPSCRQSSAPAFSHYDAHLPSKRVPFAEPNEKGCFHCSLHFRIPLANWHEVL